MGLSSGKVLRLTVFAYYQRVTDGQTELLYQYRSLHSSMNADNAQ